MPSAVPNAVLALEQIALSDDLHDVIEPHRDLPAVPNHQIVRPDGVEHTFHVAYPGPDTHLLVAELAQDRRECSNDPSMLRCVVADVLSTDDRGLSDDVVLSTVLENEPIVSRINDLAVQAIVEFQCKRLIPANGTSNPSRKAREGLLSELKILGVSESVVSFVGGNTPSDVLNAEGPGWHVIRVIHRARLGAVI